MTKIQIQHCPARKLDWLKYRVEQLEKEYI